MIQFRLRTVLLVITTLCTAFALIFSGNKFVQLVALSVIAANVLGAVAALILTYGFKMPKDGSHWNSVTRINDNLLDEQTAERD